MSLARRLWKWTAAGLAAVVVLLAVLIGGLRLWLEQSTTLVPEVVARVEKLTGLTLTFARVDARLGLYGPELVFRDAKVSSTASGVTLATASAGRVGFDIWRSITTGRMAAARVSLEGARVHLLLRSSGLELLGAESLVGEDSTGTPLRPDTLPLGHLLIENGVAIVHDLRPQGRAWLVDEVDLDLERDPAALRLKGKLRMPSSLGGRLIFAGGAEGNLSVPAELAWQGSANADSVRLAGWMGLLPDSVRLPTHGYGSLRASAGGTGATLAHTEVAFDLAALVLPAEEGGIPTRMEALAGRLEFERHDERLSLSGRGLTVRSAQQLWTRGEINAGLELGEKAWQSVWLRSPELKLEALAALIPLVPDPSLRARLAALAPAGLITDLDLALRRGTAPGEWGIAGKARFAGLAFGPVDNAPGLGVLDGELVANGASGRLRVSSRHVVLQLPEYLRAAVEAQSGHATVDWWWRPDGWRFASDDLSAASRDGRGEGKARLLVPVDPEESPRLVLDLKLHDGDVRATTKYLPTRKLSADTTAWLDAAFLGGHLSEGRLEYAGETRRFPFRDGGGLFRVRGHVEGARLHYAPGWPDLESVVADVDFRNEGFSARATSGAIAGLSIGASQARMADFKDAELLAEGRASGDLRRGIWFVQHSPLAPMLGSTVAGLTGGHGSLGVEVKLDLPIRHFADRTIEVRAMLEHAALTVPDVPGEFADVNGVVTLRNVDVDTAELTAQAFGGTLKVEAHSQLLKDGLHVTTVQAQGNAAASALQTLLGLAGKTTLSGATDWRAQLKFPHLEWRRELTAKERASSEGDVPGRPREALQIKWLPSTVHLEAPLAGLELRFPAPLAKPAAETRALRADLVIDPDAESSDAAPPRLLATREPARAATVSVRGQLGRDSLAFEWRRRPTSAPGASGPNLELRRGVVHFGAGTPVLREGTGVWLEGRVPEFDLSGWLHFDTGKAQGPGLATWLRGGQVSVDRLDAFGYVLSDLNLQFQAENGVWHIDGEGPAARGTVLAPFDLHGADPIVLNFERLMLAERLAAATGSVNNVDPATLPAISVDVKNLEVDKRRFGTLIARLVHVPQGLRLDRGELKGQSFSVSAQGEWNGTGDAQHCAVTLTVESHDLADTLAAMTLAPTLTGKGRASGELHWKGGIDVPIAERLEGKLNISLESGQVLNVQPGAGRVLGLLSVAALPRRLSLDFSDLTDKGFAFDSVSADFEFRAGNAFTDNLVVKGPAAEIGIVGRTGLKDRDYDQTAVVTGHFGGPVAVAGALVLGPAAGAALLLFSKVFKGPLSGMVRGHYHITGPWDHPKVERIGATEARTGQTPAPKAQRGRTPLPPPPRRSGA